MTLAHTFLRTYSAPRQFEHRMNDVEHQHWLTRWRTGLRFGPGPTSGVYLERRGRPLPPRFGLNRQQRNCYLTFCTTDLRRERYGVRSRHSGPRFHAHNASYTAPGTTCPGSCTGLARLTGRYWSARTHVELTSSPGGRERYLPNSLPDGPTAELLTIPQFPVPTSLTV